MYSGSSVILIVYDVTNRSSFESLSQWLDTVIKKSKEREFVAAAKHDILWLDKQSREKRPPDTYDCMFYVVANKIDLIEKEEDKKNI